MSYAMPLPARAMVEHYETLARGFHQATDPESIQACVLRWAKDAHAPVSKAAELVERWLRFKPLGEPCPIIEARLFVAKSHGFGSWPKFARHVKMLGFPGSPVAHFEAAADAIVEGNLAKLRKLLKSNSRLVLARSTREHRSTLLHYVSANGIEDFRQKTPGNIVNVAALLLEAGAQVNAVSEAYGGRSTALNLTATSVHPANAGAQIPLLELLLARGAKIQDRDVLSCLHNGRGEAAAFLASRGAPIDLAGAAGIGRLDLIQSQMEQGLAFACQYGHKVVVEFLLERGITATNALHWAAIGPHLDIVKMLLARKVPTDVEDDRFHATPLKWAQHGRQQSATPELYDQVIALLEQASHRSRRKAKQ